MHLPYPKTEAQERHYEEAMAKRKVHLAMVPWTVEEERRRIARIQDKERRKIAEAQEEARRETEEVQAWAKQHRW